jgi:hypothetical protein
VHICYICNIVIYFIFILFCYVIIFMNTNSYRHKYEKYKSKYLKLKASQQNDSQYGGKECSRFDLLCHSQEAAEKASNATREAVGHVANATKEAANAAGNAAGHVANTVSKTTGDVAFAALGAILDPSGKPKTVARPSVTSQTTNVARPSVTTSQATKPCHKKMLNTDITKYCTMTKECGSGTTDAKSSCVANCTTACLNVDPPPGYVMQKIQSTIPKQIPNQSLKRQL